MCHASGKGTGFRAKQRTGLHTTVFTCRRHMPGQEKQRTLSARDDRHDEKKVVNSDTGEPR